MTESVAFPCNPPRILALRNVIGRIEAVLSWIPDSRLRVEAEGTHLHLASHVLEPATGRVLIFDGPRADPGIGDSGDLCILPLDIPASPGNYRLVIESVVEWKFWGADAGYPPLMVDVERRTDGSLLFNCPADGSEYLVEFGPPTKFAIATPLYGLNDSERCVEIPWILSRHRGERRVLDVGYANAEPRYCLARNQLSIPMLVGLDLAATPQSGVLGVAADVLALPFAPGTFDMVVAISVIEHIGHDNSLYSDRKLPAKEFGDLEAAYELGTLLRPQGRFLITLPFGHLEDHGWFVQYDFRRLSALIEATGCELVSAEYFRYGSEGWFGPVDPLTLSRVAYRGDCAGAVVCLELVRRSTPRKDVIRVYASDIRPRGTQSSLADALSEETTAILKHSNAWSRMRGESACLRPILLFCETVNICNADCVFCPYSAQTRERGFMAPELFLRVLDQYCEMGGGYLTLTPMVGDALLDRRWMERIRSLANRREQITPSITTNLYALEKYSDDEIMEMLRILHRIHISIYGITAEECLAITRRQNFNRFLEQGRRLLELRKAWGSNCDIRAGFRLTSPRPEDELRSFLVDQLGAAVPFATTSEYANWGNSIHCALPGEATWTAQRTNQSPCVMLPLALQVYWDGRVSACSCCDYDSSNQLYLGNVEQQTLEEIFNGAKSQSIWWAQQHGELQPMCRNCTFHVPLSNLNPQHHIIQNPLDFIGG